jgi:hypothetical protein
MRDYAAVESVSGIHMNVIIFSGFKCTESVYVYVCMILVMVHSNEDVRNLPLLLSAERASLFHLSVFFSHSSQKTTRSIQRSSQRSAAAAGIRLFVRPTAAAFFVDDADDKICCLEF